MGAELNDWNHGACLAARIWKANYGVEHVWKPKEASP